jgi:hypothetical protein
MKRALMATILGLFTSASNAAIIVGLGNEPGDTDNVISANCTFGPQAPLANTIYGCLNSDRDQAVRFTADEPIFFAAGGQAAIESVDQDGFSSLQIELVGLNFNYLILNIDAVGQGGNAPDGQVIFSSNLGDSTSPQVLSPTGNNFFSLSGDTWNWIQFVSSIPTQLTLDATTDVKQVRIGSDSVSVPEPGSLALLGLGLLGIAGLRSRRHRN